VLVAIMSSLVCDYVARQKIGSTTMNLFIAEQIAVPPPSSLDSSSWWSSDIWGWFSSRVLELAFTAWDLAGFALHIGYRGVPFKWSEMRREMIRAELEAACLHLYGINRSEVDQILESFVVVRRRETAIYGEYRLKRLILERYDALAEAITTGNEYQTVLDPPPADPSCAHSESTRPSWA